MCLAVQRMATRYLVLSVTAWMEKNYGRINAKSVAKKCRGQAHKKTFDTNVIKGFE